MSNKLKNKILLIASLSFLVLFLGLIILLKNVNIDTIGPDGTKIGLSKLNINVFTKLGSNETCEKISDILGYFAILICASFGLIGLINWIKVKKFFKVNPIILLLGLFYIICIIIYILFNFVIINYRPVFILNKYNEYELEAGFPSSHTILGAFVFISCGYVLKDFIKNKYIYLPLSIISYCLAVVIIIFRLLSGLHWFTDILGSILLSSSIILLFMVMVNISREVGLLNINKEK